MVSTFSHMSNFYFAPRFFVASPSKQMAVLFHRWLSIALAFGKEGADRGSVRRSSQRDQLIWAQGKGPDYSNIPMSLLRRLTALGSTSPICS